MKSICKFATTLFIFFVFSINAFSQNTPCAPTDIVFPNADCGTTAPQVAVNLDNMTNSGIGDPGGCPNNVFGANSDGWFQFVVPPGVSGVDLDMSWSGCSGFVCVDNPGYAFYEALNGDCTNLQPFGCDGDNSALAGSNADVLITGLQPGDLILVRVWETDNQGSNVTINTQISPPNDLCENAIPLQGLGCNYGATDINEPDGWAPENYGNIFTGYEDCLGGGWTSNENGVWYTFTIDATTPQPISLDILNINCDNTGGGDLQMGLWQDNGACTLGESTFIECAVGTGNVTLGPTNLPPGDYYLYVDGNAGANCEWEFASDQLLCPDALFEDIIANSPYLCDDPLVSLTALDDAAAGGTIVPGFDFDILTDAFSDTENSVEIYDGPNGTGNLIGSFAIGTVPINSNWTINAEYFDTNTTYSLVWCDNSPDGTFGYTITDHATGAVLATGTFNHNTGTSCFTVNFGPLSGIATFSGLGVTNNGDGTGTFDPSVAGVGVHDITYSWDSETGCVGTSTQTVEVLEPTIDNVAVVNPNCNDSSGSITITASNGNVIEYSIDGGNTFQTSNVFNGLPGGLYDVVIQVGTCTAATQIELIDSTPPFVNNVSTIDETCTASNGAIDINVINGTAPFTFDWDNDGTGDNDDPEDLIGVSAGTYSVTITDVNGCTDTANATITDTPGATIDNIATTEPDCGASDGSLTIIASGGTAPLQYSIDNGTTFQASVTFTGLAAGTYDIIVQDDNGCSAASQLTLNSPSTPVIDDVSTTSAFCGNNDGTITTTASGGTAPLEYSINNGVTFQPGNVFTGLSPNTYTIIVQDANGCNVSTSAILSNQPGPTLGGVSFGNPNCGVADGSITITAFGGTPPYGFSIDNGASFQSGSLFTGLGEGTYDVVVEDDNGCTVTSTITLTDLPGPTLDNVATVDPSCGNADGSITITASGGEMPYEYSIDNGASFQPGNTFTGLLPGSYDIIIRDDNSCFENTTIALTDQLAPTVDNITTTESSCGNTNATIIITASGGVAPIEYSIDNGTTFQLGGLFTGLAAGSYNLAIQDANGCTAISSATITDQPGPTIDNVATTDPTCSDANGEIAITVSGGTTPVEYSIDNGTTFQPANVFTGLAPNTYIIVVQDANGCTANSTATLTSQPIPLIDNVATTDPACGNANGEITITATGGTAPIEYSIDNGTTFQPGNTFTGLMPGSYDIVIQDANGCTASSSATLSDQPAPIIDNVAVSDPTCGDTNGTITITATGGTAPIEYSIDNGTTFQPGTSFTGLMPGSYDIVIQDANGCTASSAATLTDQPGPTIDDIETTDPTCGNDNGAIVIIATGGTAALSYSIDNGVTFQANNVFVFQGSGVYDVIVSDANGCTDTGTVTFVEQAVPAIDNIDIADTTCGDANGEIVITGSNGTAPLSYSINGGLSFQASNTFTGLPDGTYDVIVQDANGCTVSDQAIIAPSSSPAIVSIDITATSCNEANGALAIISTGGTAPLEYSIDGGTTFQNTNNFTGLTGGNYNIVVQDALGCSVSDLAFVTPSLGIQIDNVQSNNAGCGDPGLINIMASSGLPPFEYSIDGGTTFQSVPVFPTVSGGTYDIIVQDGNGCTDETTVTIIDTGIPNIDFAILDDPSSCNSFDGSIEIIASGGAQPLEYSNNNGMVYQPSPIFTGLGANTYNLVVMDAVGCTDTVIVVLNDPIEAAIDTVFYNNPTCGEDNGSIEIIVDVSNPNYEYSIDGGNVFQGSNTFEDLPAGTYNIVMVDFLGCTAFWQPITLFNAGNPEIATIDITSPICGDDNGVVTITANGGTTPYEYSIDNINYQTAATFVGLAPGMYTVWVRDAAGCETQQDVYVTTTGEITATVITADPTACDTDDGTITITASNGTPPYEYSADNGMTYQSSNTFTGLGVNTYNVVVQDVNGCLTMLLVDLIGTDNPEILDVIIIDADCSEDNGSIEITVTGGTPNYQYSIDGGNIFQGSNTFEDLPAGMYDILVVDFKGCEATAQATVNNPGAPQIDNIEALNPSCGDVNGSIIITASSGTAPLEYSIDGGITFQTNTSFTGLDAGIYDIIVRDAAGCELFDQAILNNAGDVVIDQTFITEPICNDDNGGVVIIASGGTMPYEYSLDNGMNFQNSGTFSNVGPGTFNVVVTDANGCQATDQLMLTSDAPVLDSIGIEQPSCEAANGMISVFVQNGTANYQYSIDGGATYSGDNIFENLPTGVYDVIVEDLNGCQATQTVELFPTEGANPQIIPGGEVDLCFNEPLTLDAGVFESYQWSTGDTTAMINVDQFGVYFVTVTDAFGCTGVDNVQVNVTAPFIVEASDDETIEIGDDYTMSVIFNNPNLIYTWSGSDGSSGTGATFSTSAEIQGTIIYTVTGMDANGCSVTDEVVITIVDTSTYVMPNAFSPNGDGLNEDFGPVLTGTIEIIDFKVFNRWGELVHSDANSRWNGFYKGQRQETDVYVYMIKMETFEGELIELTGDVHLMR